MTLLQVGITDVHHSLIDNISSNIRSVSIVGSDDDIS